MCPFFALSLQSETIESALFSLVDTHKAGQSAAVLDMCGNPREYGAFDDMTVTDNVFSAALRSHLAQRK